MITLPKAPTNFSTLMRISAGIHFNLLKRIFIWLLLLTIGKDLVDYLGGYPDKEILQWVVNGCIALWILFFWGASLIASKNFFDGQNQPFSAIFKKAISRLPKAIVVILFYLVLFIFFYWFANLFTKYSVPLSFFLLFSLPLNFLYVLFYYATPLIFLENAAILSAFIQTTTLIGTQQWFRGFGLFAMSLIIWILISPDTVHGHVLANYYLSAPFDLIILCLLVPLLNSMIILLLNDLRLRISL